MCQWTTLPLSRIFVGKAGFLRALGVAQLAPELLSGVIPLPSEQILKVSMLTISWVLGERTASKCS